MSLESYFQLPWWKKISLRILSCGPKIYHLAVVMDGNRRFAKKLKQDIVFGHQKGSKKHYQLLEMTRLMGIKELTVYAFSVENFKRSKEELDDLKIIMANTLREMLANIEVLHSRGIRYRFQGELHMLNPELQTLIEKVTEATKGNSEVIINCAVAYSSRVEISKAIGSVLQKIQDDELTIDDVNEKTVENFFYNPGGLPVDLWIRTSGETRLSDFLTWQSDSAILYFTSTLWPEFGILDMLRAVLQFQSNKLKVF